MKIEIQLDQFVTSDLIQLHINNQSLDAKYYNNIICIDYDASFGLHQLKIKNLHDQRLKINSVTLDGNSLRKTLYLSWLEDGNGQRTQPATELWQANQVWILPFGYPLSHWIECVENKIANSFYGSDLYKSHWLWWPESLSLRNAFPQVIKDFFYHNFNFTAVNKNQFGIEQIPYMLYNKSIDDIDALTQEIVDNHEFLKLNASHYGQQHENLKEFAVLSMDKIWQITWLYMQATPTQKGLDLLHNLPVLQKVIKDLNLDPWWVFVGRMPPKSFIYPHIDQHSTSENTYKNYRGCTQLYIPVIWPQHNYIKLAGAGHLDLSVTGPVVVNNDSFTHSVVNDSDADRLVVGIRCHRRILKDCTITDKLIWRP